jgi:hypothetical protein
MPIAILSAIIGLVLLPATMQAAEPPLEMTLYRNTSLGFSMEVPTTMYSTDIGCEPYNEFFKSKGGMVNTVIAQSGSTVVIGPEYRYTGTPPSDALRFLWTHCENKTELQKEIDDVMHGEGPFSGLAWQIHIEKNMTLRQAVAHIREEFDLHPDCTIRRMRRHGMIEIKILGGGQESNCFFPQKAFIRYSPTLQKLAYWGHKGQKGWGIGSDTFCNESVICVQEKMTDSFRLE